MSCHALLANRRFRYSKRQAGRWCVNKGACAMSVRLDYSANQRELANGGRKHVAGVHRAALALFSFLALLLISLLAYAPAQAMAADTPPPQPGPNAGQIAAGLPRLADLPWPDRRAARSAQPSPGSTPRPTAPKGSRSRSTCRKAASGRSWTRRWPGSISAAATSPMRSAPTSITHDLTTAPTAWTASSFRPGRWPGW